MTERQLRIVNEKGLHARASAQFVEVVEAHDATAEVENDGMCVSGDSIMGLLMLAASRGAVISRTTRATMPNGSPMRCRPWSRQVRRRLLSALSGSAPARRRGSRRTRAAVLRPSQPASTYFVSSGQGRYLVSASPSCSTFMIARQVSSPMKSASSSGPIGWFAPSFSDVVDRLHRARRPRKAYRPPR